MKVTGWTDWDDERYEEFHGTDLAEEDEAKEAIIQEMRTYGYKFTGGYHQNGKYGVPIIDGQWKYCTSQRRWGHIMVMVYPDKIDNSDGYGYVDWAWSVPNGEEMVVPQKIVIY